MSHGPLVTISPFATLAPGLVELHERSKTTRRASKAKGTLRAYASCLRSFEAWCRTHDLVALPASPEVVVLFIEAERIAGRRVSTIETKISAIRWMHLKAGHASPTASEAVIEEMEGVRREIGVAPKRKRAATADLIGAMLTAVDGDGAKAVRDRALLALGFAAALRRSELVALDVADLVFRPQGIEVTIRRSKTDQIGEGRVIAVPDGPRIGVVPKIRAWLAASGIEDGALFRQVGKSGTVRMTRQRRDGQAEEARLSGRSVAEIVKACAGRAGLDVADLSGHSLRSGFITSAAEAGAALDRIMEVSRHVEPRTVQSYIRRASLFRNHAGDSFL